MSHGEPHAGSRPDWEAIRQNLEETRRRVETVLKPDAKRSRAIMEERARKLAETVKEARTAADPVNVIQFSMQGEHFALETRLVREFAALRRLTPVPGGPAFLLGLTNLRGIHLPVIDLRALMGAPAPGLSDLSSLLVAGREEPELAILTGNDCALTELDRAALSQRADRDRRTDGYAFITGITPEAVMLLDGERLLKAARPGEPALNQGKETREGNT
ncbi:chemotaxis protein CheW [Limibacillus sp. MBR-115]|jgi:purine-binding chemotaxis protein CheW|uniref:chemotaxis protein CheW n=1 Tax=Limibacillus sp. MBR-115 TaxID=3156465 RepID=UPI003390FA1A